MKKELQRNVNGVTSGGGSIQHPLSIHSASIGSRWKVHGLSLMMTILLLFTMGIGQMWGADATYYLQTPGASTPALTGDFYTTAACNQDVDCSYNEVAYTKAVKFGGNAGTSTGNYTYTDRCIRYDCRTNKTEIKVIAYSTNASKKVCYWHVTQGTLGSDGTKSSSVTGSTTTANDIKTYDYTITSDEPSSFYVGVDANSNVYIVQIIAVEKGAKTFPRPGTDGYLLNFKKGRVNARSGAASIIDKTATTDGIEIHQNQNYEPGNTGTAKLQTNNTNYIQFSVAEKIVLSFVTSSTNQYTVGAKGKNTDKITPVANKAQLITIPSAGTYYINPQGSNVTPTSMAFDIPTITYNKNDVDAEGTMSTNTWTVAANGFTAPEGKEFKEWNNKADGSGDAIAVGDEMLTDTTLYAIWQASVTKYTITYSKGTYGGGDAIPDGKKDEGVDFTLSSSTYTRANYRQTGWATEDGGAKVYELGGTYSTDDDEELFPFWTPTYAITIDDATVNGEVAAGVAEAIAGEEVTVTATPAANYMLDAWNVYKTGESETKVSVAAGKFTMPAYAVTVSATFKADTRKKILYVTGTAEETVKANDKLYAALKDDYRVTIVGPTSDADQTSYDLVVLHESVGGGNYGAAAVAAAKAGNTPVLNTKTYFYGNTNDASQRWQWGAPNAGQTVNGATLNSAYCNVASHPLFSGVTMTAGFFEITDDAAAKCMQPIGSFTSGKEGYILATTPNAGEGNGCAIHELTPAQRGASAGKYLMISVSNAKLDALNANGQKLFQNAAAYLLDGDASWSPATAPTSASIEATGGAIHAVGDAVTMTASASNVSATTLYAWYKGETLEAAEEAGAIQTAKTAAAGGTTYSIASCELESAGTYWCVIVNAEGCEASASLELSVSSTPIDTYDITYVSAKGTAPDAENSASVTLAEITGVSGWEHQGWKANVDVVVDDATVTANTLIANGKTAVLSADVTFTAVWRQVLTVTYNANGGTCGTASATWGEGDAALVLPDATVANLVFDGWYTEATGGTLIGRAGSTYTPTADIEIFAHFGAKLYQAVYANGFDAFINQSTKTVTVYYLDGTPAPALTSVKAMKADGTEVAAGTFVDNGSTIDVTIDEKTATYTVNKSAVAPYTYVSDDAVVFDGTETYVKTGNSFSTDAGKLGWKFSKNDDDWSRETPGNNRIYFFIGATESVTFTTGCTSDRSAKFYRNGELIKTETIAKNTGAVTVAGSNAPAMYAVVSNQTSGDGSIKSMTLAPWVPVTAVALKEGEDPISSKEIWASTSFTLTAEVTPDNASNKTITWTSSDDAIATVADGVVTGVAANASPVTITASTVDGVTATCEVTVTAAPEPSAAPVITAQPASANYYEEASIAALEVVATGESLSYQWYLGADAIDGAIAATYQPTVSAIGSYVYHCVVTNTEAGKLPTSLASSNATITIAEDPSAIKLINKSTGAINTTNFITGVTANDNVHGENGAIFGSSSSNASVKGLSGLNKVVVYNATTTQTKIKLVLYNTNSAAQEVVLSTMAEGDVDPVGQAISVPSKELYSTGYITYNSTKNRTFYLHTKSTNVQISQIQVIESGDELAVAGKKDYSLNLNKGRVYAYASTAQTWEGLSMNLGSNYSPATTEYITFKDNALSFSVPNDVCLTITPARAGDKYYVTDVADGTDNATTTVAGTPNSFDLTGGVGKVWYIRSQGSNVQLTNIAFSAPKCAEPAFNSLANSDICSGDPYVALNGTATVADAGVPTYKWYAEGADESDPAAVLATTATYTPSADGKYYVIATNHLAGFSDNTKKSDLVSVTTHAGTAITEGLVDLRGVEDAVVTLTVTATGKALHYAWKESATIDGTYTDVAGAADAASLDVTITDGMSKYYKVVVSGGCGAAQESIAKVEEYVAVSQQDVTGSIIWDWTEAASVNEIKLTASTTPKKNEGFVMANGAATIYNNANFESDKLYLEGEYIIRTEGGKLFQGQLIKFNTTKAGFVRVKFSNTGGNPARELYVNGVGTGFTSGTATAVTTELIEVPVGEVAITAYLADKSEDASQKYVRVYKVEFYELAHQRTSGYAAGDLGTVCLEDATIIDGANLYEIAGLDQYGYMAFDQILSGELEAGKPYLFEVTNPSKISFYKPVGAAHSDDETAVKGMIGTFAGTTLYQNVAQNYYYFSGRHIWRVNDFTVEIPIPAHRCYVDMDALKNAVASSPLPGRRRVTLGVNGKNAPTAIDNAEATEAPRKVMINGTLFILRGEKMYDATGRLVK